MHKKIIALFLAGTLSLSYVLSASATDLTDKQKSTIVASCSSIKSNLKSIQHLDARTRTYYGRYYENIFTDYMVALNTRLVKNSTSDSDLAKIQSDFSSTRNDFNSDYIDYSKTFEELIAIDCVNSPSDFYSTLKKVQEKRAKIVTDIKKLSKIITDFRAGVVKLKDSYGKK